MCVCSKCIRRPRFSINYLQSLVRRISPFIAAGTMNARIGLMLTVGIFASFYDSCLSDTKMEIDRFVDDLSIVELPEAGMKYSGGDSKMGDRHQQQTVERKSRRIKRSSWSVPRNTSARIVLDIIMPVIPLNNTFSALTLDLIYRFVLPTYTQLNNLYSTLGRLDTNDLDGEIDENQIDFEFFEEQRANHERRSLYQHAQGVFEKFVYINY